MNKIEAIEKSADLVKGDIAAKVEQAKQRVEEAEKELRR